MCFSLNLSEKGRNRLGVAVAVLNVILFLAGVALILCGIYIQIHVNDELILLESYSSGLLPNFVISVGTIMTLLNIVSAKIAYDSGFDLTREKYRMTLIPLVVFMLLTTIVIMSTGITCLTHRSSVEEALHEGLMDSLKRYKKNLQVKITLDKLQMFSRCCGSRSYKDWFIVSWIGTEFINTKNHGIRRKLTDGNFYTDNVPFSCCDVKSTGPCVTSGIQHSGNRNGNNLSVYENGCTNILMDEMENKILQPVGFFIMALFAIQFLATVLLRYLQTSIEDAYLEGDTEGPGKAYFCPNFCPSCLATGDPGKYVKKGALDKGKTQQGDSVDSADDTNETIVDMEGPPGMGNHFGEFRDIGGFGGGAGGGGGGHDHGHEKRRKEKVDKKKRKEKDKSKSKSKSPKAKKTKPSKPKKTKSPKTPKAPKVKKPKTKKSFFKKPKFGRKK